MVIPTKSQQHPNNIPTGDVVQNCQADPVDDEMWDILGWIVCAAPKLDPQSQHWAENIYICQHDYDDDDDDDDDDDNDNDDDNDWCSG